MGGSHLQARSCTSSLLRLRWKLVNGRMGTFSSQLLLDKLAKLNTSQQSIETVSQWCQFHRKVRSRSYFWSKSASPIVRVCDWLAEHGGGFDTCSCGKRRAPLLSLGPLSPVIVFQAMDGALSAIYKGKNVVLEEEPKVSMRITTCLVCIPMQTECGLTWLDHCTAAFCHSLWTCCCIGD